MAESKNEAAIVAEVRAKALVDRAFKKQLLADPAGVLRAAGLTIDPSVTIRVLESTAKERYLVLPYVDVEKGRISEDQLANVSGGMQPPASCVNPGGGPDPIPVVLY